MLRISLPPWLPRPITVLTAALVAAGGLFAAGPDAQAAVIFELTSDHCTGGCGTPPYGTVSLTQNGTTVDVTVHLNPTNSFVKTGSADFEAFKFNGTGVVLADITVDVHAPVLQAETGAFNGDGTGQFSFGIACPTCANGSSGAFTNDIIFHVANATIADLTAVNNLGNIFVADLYGFASGNTGPIDSTGPGTQCGIPGTPPCEFTNVPEPASLALLGFGHRGSKGQRPQGKPGSRPIGRPIKGTPALGGTDGIAQGLLRQLSFRVSGR